MSKPQVYVLTERCYDRDGPSFALLGVFSTPEAAKDAGDMCHGGEKPLIWTEVTRRSSGERVWCASTSLGDCTITQATIDGGS